MSLENDVYTIDLIYTYGRFGRYLISILLTLITSFFKRLGLVGATRNIMTTSEEQFHEELVAMVSQGQRDDGSAIRRTASVDGFRWVRWMNFDGDFDGDFIGVS